MNRKTPLSKNWKGPFRMQPRHALRSFLDFFVVFFFLAMALFWFALSYLPEARMRIADLFLNHFELCTPISLGFFLIAFLLLMGFYGLNRGKSLRIEMGKNGLVWIESQVIRQTLEEVFEKKFQRRLSLTDVEIIRGEKLEMMVSIPREIEEKLLTDVEQQLQVLLKERFGYTKPFHLILKSTEAVL